MALPVDIITLNYSLNGSPWVRVSATPSINTNTLEYSLDGGPWVGQPLSSFDTYLCRKYEGGQWVAKALRHYSGTWDAHPLKDGV